MFKNPLKKALNELVFQNEEKEKRAAELVLANKELAFQNNEKERRAAELVIANKELAFQNQEKEDRAAELVLANKELLFQNDEKERRAAELVIANNELAFQNKEKENRAAELVLANKELLFLNEEKEKRAAELKLAYKELESFNYISSHDLQEPLRKIQVFTSRLIADEEQNLSEKGTRYVQRIKEAALRMQMLLIDLLAYSNTNTSLHEYEETDFNTISEKVIAQLRNRIEEKQAIVELKNLPVVNGIKFQLKQLIHNLVDNALKSSKPGIPPRISIEGTLIPAGVCNSKLSVEKKYFHIQVIDNGIGFEPKYNEHIFEVFKQVHYNPTLTGSGIGLAIVKKIVQNHGGEITACGKLNEGVTFDIYLPAKELSEQ